MILNSYAKLNLYLSVLNKRKDNYHNINTVLERISLCDKIILKSRRDKKIKIICNASDVPTDSSNLAYQSARLLQEEFNLHQGVEIKIAKRIPVGSGLGGGSSNAAFVLLSLNKLWKLHLNKERLAKLAQKIGSDVPFFIYEFPFAEGKGRGDEIKLLKSAKKIKLWHILVVPKIKVSTPLIYKRWDEYPKNKRARLTRAPYNVKILKLLKGGKLFNGLEAITCELYPEVSRVKDRLAGLGVKSILMSGSGPAVMGIVSSRKEALSLGKRLKQENRSWQVFVARTR